MSSTSSRTILLLIFAILHHTHTSPQSRSSIFIDKTNFVKDFFTADSRHNYITCPRRFGKSSNLKLLKAFAEIKLDKKMNPISWQNTNAYKIFKNKTIGLYPDIVSEHLGQHGVIYLNLNMDHLEIQNNAELITFLDKQWKGIYNRFKWATDITRRRTNTDAAFVQKVLDGSLTESEKSRYLYHLARLLHDVLDDAKVIVLVDDYDSAFTQSVYESDLDVTQYYQYLNDILSVAFGSARKYVSNVLMTGTCSMCYYIDNSKITDIAHQAFLDDTPFVSFCGFLEKEITPVLDQLHVDPVERFKIKDLYDGYRTRHKPRSIYNPNSLKKYFASPKWNDTYFWNERYQRPDEPYERVNPPFKFWTIETREFIIFSFLYFNEFFNELSVPAHTSNRVESEFPLNKTYDQRSYERFSRLLKIIHDDKTNVPNISDEDKQQYLPIVRTFAFEHGYFSHSRRKHHYRIPNAEVIDEIARRVAILNSFFKP